MGQASQPRRSSRCGVSRLLLLLEDDEEQAAELEEQLAVDRWQVALATSAADALRLVYEERPLAALVDIHLPDRDGIRFAEMATMLDFRLPVILMSGDPHAVARAKHLRSGAFAVVSKPIDAALLRSLLLRL